MRIRLAILLALCANLLAVPLVCAGADFDFNPAGFYAARPDLRLCASPVCGGYFLRQLNRKLTRCADGTRQSECYVATLHNLPATASGEALLLRGKIRTRHFDGIGDFGEFVVRRAWQAATDQTPRGRFVGLENNGIVCITTPCFSIDQYLLNRSVTRAVSDIDLGAVAAPKELEQAARKLLANGGVLIAAGVNRQVEDVSGMGLEFSATQFYLPLR